MLLHNFLNQFYCVEEAEDLISLERFLTAGQMVMLKPNYKYNRSHPQNTSSNNHNNNSNPANSKLKLQELEDGVVNMASPLDGIHNAAEVIIQKDDV